MSSGSALGLVFVREDLLRGVFCGSTLISGLLTLSVERDVVVDGGGLYSSSPSLWMTHESPSWAFSRDRAGVRSLTILLHTRSQYVAEKAP